VSIPILGRARAVLRRDSLQAERGLEPHPDHGPNAWRATTNQASFLIAGPIRAGWWRLRLSMQRVDEGKNERAQTEFRADFGDGFDVGPSLERLLWTGTLDEQEVYLHLARPARGLRFQTLGSPGSFELLEFSAKRLSRLGSAVTAVSRKLKLLREYNCTGAVFRRGLKMIFSGRWGDVRRKLFKALPDTRRFHPDTDAYLKSLLGLGRWRVPLPNTERLRLKNEEARLPARPRIAVVLPIHEIASHALYRGVESVLAQAYRNWELHLVFAAADSPDLIRVADEYAEQDEQIRVTVASGDGSINDALVDALDRIEAEHVVFLHAGFEMVEGALLELAKKSQSQSDAHVVLNVPEGEGLETLNNSAFRAGAAGQQVNLYRLEDVRGLAHLPAIGNSSNLPVGTEIARQLPAARNIVHYPEVLAYPVTCLTPLAPGVDEVEDFLQPPKPLLLTGNICGISGWDYVVFEIARGLHSLGAHIRLNAASNHQADLLPPYLLPTRRLRKEGDRNLVLAPPHLLEYHFPPPGSAIFTMWESDRLDPKWVNLLNEAAVVIVPSQWAVESFRASGVTVPMEVVNLGHDALTYHAAGDWPDVCTFGTAAALWGGGVRKNTHKLIDAFQRAFPDETDVRLRVKITPKCELPECDDPRIEVLRKFLLPADLAAWYRSLTAYVNGSSAEGFGLHLVEAMACGRPIISTAYSAVTEYFDEAVGYPVAHRLTAAEGSIYSGSWAEIDEDDLVRAMRQVYDDQQEARQRGERAAARTRRFTWKEAGRRLARVLEQHLGERVTV